MYKITTNTTLSYCKFRLDSDKELGIATETTVKFDFHVIVEVLSLFTAFANIFKR